MTIVPDGEKRSRVASRTAARIARTPMVVFIIDHIRFAVDLGSVERIINALTVNTLKKSGVILGEVRIAGRYVNVLNTRVCLDLQDRGIRSGDHLLVAGHGERTVALVADAVVGIVDPRSRGEVREAAHGGMPGVVRATVDLEGEPIHICDLDVLFELAERKAVSQTTAGEPVHSK